MNPIYLHRTRPVPPSRSPRTFLFLCAVMAAIGFWNWKAVVTPEREQRAAGEAQDRSVRYILDSSPVVEPQKDSFTF